MILLKTMILLIIYRLSTDMLDPNNRSNKRSLYRSYILLTYQAQIKKAEKRFSSQWKAGRIRLFCQSMLH